MYKLLVVCKSDTMHGVSIHSQVINFDHIPDAETAFDRLSAVISQSSSYVREVWKLY